MGEIDQNDAVRRFMAALESGGDIDVLDRICTPSVAHEWRATLDGFAFDDRTFTVDDTVAEGSRVAILWTITATHTGEYAGIAPTSKRTSNTGSAFFTFDHGKIASVTTHYDADRLYEQIGPPTKLPD